MKFCLESVNLRSVWNTLLGERILSTFETCVKSVGLPHGTCLPNVDNIWDDVYSKFNPPCAYPVRTRDVNPPWCRMYASVNRVSIGSDNGLFGAKPLSKPLLVDCQLDHQEQTSVKFETKYKTFFSGKCIWKYRPRNGCHFVQGEMSQPWSSQCLRMS